MMRSSSFRRWIFGLGSAALGFALPLAALADNYPDRPVRMVVPFGPGSGTDILGRSMAEALSSELGGNFIVENRPGASGILGAEAVAKAAPDGYTLLVASNTTHSANPALFRKLPYDPVKDFAPVTRLVQWTAVVLVGPNVQAQSLKELEAWARAREGKASYAYANSGGQLVAATFVQETGLKGITPVAYKSAPSAITDLIGGHVDFLVVDTASAIGLLRKGERVRAIGILAESRHEALPAVPTFRESGYGDMNPPLFWGGIFAPAGVPAAVVQRLDAALRKIIARPDVVKRLEGLGAQPWAGSPQELNELVLSQLTVWSNRVKAAGIEPQ